MSIPTAFRRSAIAKLLTLVLAFSGLQLIGIITPPISSAAGLTCAQGGPCSIGDTGPGGGIIFYKSSTSFKCGSDLLSDCNLLEVAPSNWKTSEPKVTWTTTSCGPRCLTVPGIVDVRTPDFSSASLGLGYKYSLAMLSQVNDVSFAAGQARGYAGGGKNDWYLPTSAELNQLCKYVSGQAWVSDTTVCTGSATPALGMQSDLYWSSNEFPKPLFVDATVNDVYMSWTTNFSNATTSFFSQTNNNAYVAGAGGAAGIRGKDNVHYVRPVRAFYVASPNGDSRSYGLEYSQGNNLSFTRISGFQSYTIDAWVRVQNFTVPSVNSQNVVPVVLVGGNTYGQTLSIWANTSTDWQLDWNGVGNRHFTCPALVAKSWQHVAISQNSSNIGMWVDGAACTSPSTTSFYSFSSTNVGFSPYNPGSASGLADISGMRVENSTNYSPAASTITVPGYPLPSTSNTKLLLNNTTVTTGDKDSSGLVTLTVNGTLTQSKLLQVTPTLSLALPSNATTATYLSPSTITASVSTPGAVTFKAGGIAISGCTSVSAVSTVATCLWTPGSVNASTVLTADFTPTDATGYAALSGAGSTTINVGKATQTISFTQPANMTYLDADQTLTYSVGSGLTVAITSSTTSVCTIQANKIHIVTAGTCTVAANQAGDTNYSAATPVTKTITIAKYAPTISVTGATTYNYSGVAQGPSSSTPTGSTGSVTYLYSGVGSTTYSVSATKPTNAGDYTVTASITTDTNYLPATSSAYSFTISSASQGSSLVITSTSGTYGSSVVLQTSGATGGSGSLTFIRDSGPCTVSGTSLTPTSAGICYVTATKASDGNYLATSSVSTAITIAKQTPIFTWSGVSKVYGDIFALTTPTSSTPGTWTYSSGTTAVVTLSGETATVVGNGSSLITATFTPTDTTNFVSSGTTTMTITAAKAAITVTPTAAQSKVYGTSDPVLTYSVTTGALVGSDQLVGVLSYTSAGQNTAVGSYSIISGTLTNANNSNYTITLGSVNFAITQATQAAVTLSSLSSAYNPSNKTVSLTGSGGTGSGTYSYAIDSTNTTTGCSISISTLTYTTAGTCIIAVTRSSDTNYLARTDAVSFSIGLASQTITFASLTAKSYSSDTFTVTASASSGLLVIFTSGSTSICTTSGVNGTVINLRDVGLCVINANQPGDANTAAAAQVVQSFTINPRAITVTADSKSKVYGTTSDPVLSYSITTGSLVLGDSLSGALSRGAGTDVGTYLISAGTLTSANNPKYSITYVSDNLTITKATPTLVLTYPNSNIVILTPGITDTATVATSSSNGTLSFASPTSVSICSVDATSGVISFSAAGVCQIVMTSAATTNYLQASDTETVTSVLQSTSLAGIPSGNLIPMGGTFYASPILTQTVSATVGSNGASVSIPANALPSTTAISISLLTDATTQLALISGASSSVLSVVVSWVSPDGSVPQTSTGNPISVTLTNPSIKAGAKVYSVVGGASTLVGTATVDGSITSQITSDPVLVVVNPAIVVTPPVVTSAPVDNSAAIAAAQALAAAQAAAKVLAEKKAAEEAAKVLAQKQEEELAAKVLADQQAADALAAAKAAQDALDAAALKAAQEKMAADAKVLAEAKAAADAAAVKAAQEAADASAKAAAALQAAKDAAAAAAKAALLKKPALTLYSLSSKLTLSSYDNAYLQRYVRSLKNGASVTCLGYIYKKGTTLAKATALAKSQATAVCTLMKKSNKTLKTSIILLDSSKAPKAAVGSKWVAVSYRIDGFKAQP